MMALIVSRLCFRISSVGSSIYVKSCSVAIQSDLTRKSDPEAAQVEDVIHQRESLADDPKKSIIYDMRTHHQGRSFRSHSHIHSRGSFTIAAHVSGANMHVVL
jgi:3-hydroxyisobutyrate dehydrogenase-like beta-hydroxyacid dehydrogenase